MEAQLDKLQWFMPWALPLSASPPQIRPIAGQVTAKYVEPTPINYGVLGSVSKDLDIACAQHLNDPFCVGTMLHRV